MSNTLIDPSSPPRRQGSTALRELQHIREITQQCVAQALAAQQRVSRYASYHSNRAEDFRKQAARASSPEMQARLLRLASLHEVLGAQPAPRGARSDGAPPISADLPNNDRQAALRARLELSQHLYYYTQAILRDTRDRLDRILARQSEVGTYPVSSDELRELIDLTEQGLARGRNRAALARSSEEAPLDEARPSNAAEDGEGLLEQKSAEDPIAQARRHMAEAQVHIIRQEALVLKLSSDPRHAALAAEAQEILDTLKQTLDLARRHLEIELRR